MLQLNKIKHLFYFNSIYFILFISFYCRAGFMYNKIKQMVQALAGLLQQALILFYYT